MSKEFARRFGWFAALLLVCSGCERQQTGEGVSQAEGSDEAVAEVGATTEEAGAVEETAAEAAWVSVVPGPAGEWKQVVGEGAQWKEEEGVLEIPSSFALAGMRWSGKPPVAPFEIELEARRTDGTDFFCGLTVPTRSTEECVSLVVGGWGGGLVGISSIDEFDASENEAMLMMEFEKARWYRIRLSFADEQIKVWIDDKEVIDIATEHRRLSLRPGEIEECAPFGLATYDTCGEIRAIRWRTIAAEG